MAKRVEKAAGERVSGPGGVDAPGPGVCRGPEAPVGRADIAAPASGLDDHMPGAAGEKSVRDRLWRVLPRYSLCLFIVREEVIDIRENGADVLQGFPVFAACHVGAQKAAALLYRPEQGCHGRNIEKR